MWIESSEDEPMDCANIGRQPTIDPQHLAIYLTLSAKL